MEPKKGPESRGHLERIAFIQDLGKTLVSADDSAEVLRQIMQKTKDFFRPRGLSFLLLDERSQELCSEIVLGSPAEEQGARLRLGEGAAGWAALHAEPVLVEDLRTDPRFPNPTSGDTGDQRSVLCVPVQGRESVLGVIKLGNGPSGRSFSEAEALTLRIVADYAAIALENARHIRRMRELTVTDDCTGLYNARHLNQVLEGEIYRSSRFGHALSLVFMDLDRFKNVNDAYGHLSGSRVLGMTGELIKGQLRLIDSAFRYGGDEFVLLLPHTSKPNAVVVVKRLQEALNSSVFPAGDGRNVSMTASYGVASFPADGRTGPELLRVADQALYRVKSTTRNAIALAGEEPASEKPAAE
jgi:diguanylate cyclase (GGDEF)-like protein